MAGLLVHGFVDTVWYRPSVHTLWWLMLSLIASQNIVSPAQNKFVEDVVLEEMSQ